MVADGPRGAACQSIKEAPVARFIAGFARDESGATAIEYALLIALLALALVGVMTGIGGALFRNFNAISPQIPGA
jgi:pilus assembly protein Flp/PilA